MRSMTMPLFLKLKNALAPASRAKGALGPSAALGLALALVMGAAPQGAGAQGLPQGALTTAASSAVPSAVVTTEQVRAELVALAPLGLVAGQTFWLGLQLQHQPHWHSYWKNPGDSGLPTSFQWTLPAGLSPGEIAWPTPKPLPVGPLVNYGYEGALLLAVPVQVSADFKPSALGDSLSLQLHAEWLICKDVCIPQGGDFVLKLPVRAATAAQAALFEQAQAQRPNLPPGASGSANIQGDALAVQIQGLPAAWHGKDLQFMPETPGVIDHAAQLAGRWQGGVWSAKVPLSAQRSESPLILPVVLTAPGATAGAALPLKVLGTWPALAAAPTEPVVGTVAAPGAATAALTAAVTATAANPATARGPGADASGPGVDAGGMGLALAFLFALLGGALLNLMPCVFPILSLKVLGFATHGQDRRTLLANGLAYTAGVVLSFVALAALFLLLRAGGAQIGWGFQLQSPAVVALLAALFSLIGLNLAGVYELGSLLPSSWASTRLRHPLMDSALTGVLAVAVASPCTAPFMGASLGVAATLPAAGALALFATLGLGMALPYLAASAWPGLARALPRPGAWMLHFKTAMAFPMFATVVWLLWVLGLQIGVDGAAAFLGFLVVLAFAAWAWGSAGLGRGARWGLGGLAALLLAAALAWVLPLLTGAEGEGSETLAAAASAGAVPGGATATPSSPLLPPQWEAWSVQRVQQAQSQGQAVFVDFTAAWCVTCQFNKRTVLGQPEVQTAFAAKRVLLLRADWTKRDAAIGAELARLGRSGVPVYALYAPGVAAPQLLNEILTPTAVQEALSVLP